MEKLIDINDENKANKLIHRAINNKTLLSTDFYDTYIFWQENIVCKSGETEEESTFGKAKAAKPLGILKQQLKENKLTQKEKIK